MKKDLNMPGLLPDFLGDGITAATRTQETRLLNSNFFNEVIGEEEPYWHEERMRRVQEALWDALQNMDPSLTRDQVTLEFSANL